MPLSASAAFACLLGSRWAVEGALAGSVRAISQRQLYVSQPDPAWFGNRPNQPGTPGWTSRNWLTSRFHFNFAEHDQGADGFGVLRVLNDDLVQPRRGFGLHPHRDMEIMTFVLQGSLTHKDSMGTEETLGRGAVQFMTAGAGIQHSEHNLQDTALRFVQCWVVPRRRNLRPRYGSMPGGAEAEANRRNRWAHVVSDVEGTWKTPVRIHQDCNVFLAELSPGASLRLDVAAGRQGYLLCAEGGVRFRDGREQVHLRQHDAAELKGPVSLEPAAEEGALLLLFEMRQEADRQSRA